MQKLFALSTALYKGQSLSSPETWKSVQLLMPPFCAILAAIPHFIPLGLSEENISSIAYGFATLAVVCNSYLTVATTDKIGMPSKAKR